MFCIPHATAKYECHRDFPKTTAPQSNAARLTFVI